VRQVGDQPRLYYDARLTNHQDLRAKLDKLVNTTKSSIAVF